MIGAVIWRNRYWDSNGRTYGYSGGHLNHAHVECSTYAECVALGHWFQSQGFRVGEHPVFGGVCRDCHSGRAHYNGLALDLNKSGTFGQSLEEMQHIDRYIPHVIRRGVSVTQLTKPVPIIGEDDMTDREKETLFGKLNEINLRLVAVQFDTDGMPGKLQGVHDSLVKRLGVGGAEADRGENLQDLAKKTLEIVERLKPAA